MVRPADTVTPSRVRTRLFPALLALVGLPTAGLAAWFYIMSVRAVESVLERQTADAVRVVAEGLATTYPQLQTEASLPARAREVVSWYSARAHSPEEAERVWREQLEPFLVWMREGVEGRSERIVYLDDEGLPLVQYPQITTAAGSLLAVTGDARGLPSPGVRLQVSVQRGTPTGTAIRFARAVRALRGQRSPGFVYVDVPLAVLLPETRRGEVQLAIADRSSDTWLSAPPALQGQIPLSFPPLTTTLSAAMDSTLGSRFTTDRGEHIASLVHLEDPPWTAVALIRAESYLAGPRRTGAITVASTLVLVVVAGVLIFGLVRRVQQRTSALELANSRIEEETRQKSDFLSRMSHDLRTPMNAIIGYTRILLRRAKGALEDRQYRNLENIQTSADNLLVLINEILDLSRIEAGRIELRPEPVDVVQLVGECITSVAPLAKPGVELVQELVEAPAITTDPERVRRVVMNLLGNAVKFTEEGSITVSLKSVDSGVELAVADTGVGIPAEDLPHIFQEFRQVERQVGEKTEGTGLGLAIAARSVEMLGGTISAESEVGKGTTFTLRIGDYSGSEARP